MDAIGRREESPDEMGSGIRICQERKVVKTAAQWLFLILSLGSSAAVPLSSNHKREEMMTRLCEIVKIWCWCNGDNS